MDNWDRFETEAPPRDGLSISTALMGEISPLNHDHNPTNPIDGFCQSVSQDV